MESFSHDRTLLTTKSYFYLCCQRLHGQANYSPGKKKNPQEEGRKGVSIPVCDLRRVWLSKKLNNRLWPPIHLRSRPGCWAGGREGPREGSAWVPVPTPSRTQITGPRAPRRRSWTLTASRGPALMGTLVTLFPRQQKSNARNRAGAGAEAAQTGRLLPVAWASQGGGPRKVLALAGGGGQKQNHARLCPKLLLDLAMGHTAQPQAWTGHLPAG